MTTKHPTTELQPQFSSNSATPTAWADACKQLEQAEIFWLSTVRPDGRPHVTPLLAIWLDDALYFCTGENERKAKNLVSNAQCILTTGCNSIKEGRDLVIEGEAVRVLDEAKLQRIADSYEAKYGNAWRFKVEDAILQGEAGNAALVYEVAPITAFGFGKGEPFSQTRWRF